MLGGLLENCKNMIKSECNICNFPYDEDQHIPMLLCQDQHNCCSMCVDSIFQSDSVKCPECRRSLKRDNVVRFRYL